MLNELVLLTVGGRVSCALSDTAGGFSMKTSETILNPKVLSLFPFDDSDL